MHVSKDVQRKICLMLFASVHDIFTRSTWHRTFWRDFLDDEDILTLKTSWHQLLVETTWRQGRLYVKESKIYFFTFFFFLFYLFIFAVTQFFYRMVLIYGKK